MIMLYVSTAVPMAIVVEGAVMYIDYDKYLHMLLNRGVGVW